MASSLGYSKKLDSKLFNMTINGLDVIAEEISPNESFNRRETSRKSIIGGTESVVRTTYVHRDWAFKLHLPVNPQYPNMYDKTFCEWQSKNTEIISRELGGKFNAEVIVKRTHSTPRYLEVDVHVIEIPKTTSLIPGDTIKVPTTKVVKSSNKNKGKNKGKNSNSKTKKSTKKSNTKKNSKKKGSNITKVRK